MVEEYKFKFDYPELEEQYNFTSKQLVKDKINFVISHGNCSDGMMSSTIVQKWMTENMIDISKVTFYHAIHDNDFSELLTIIRDKYVLICDFSFKKDLFDKMIIATNGNILILDHHKTALNELKYISPKFVTFDMNHSGAFITIWFYEYS